jgi:glyoxylase-like metal-dependent hydrolase (beta-lactamase superfamily II)
MRAMIALVFFAATSVFAGDVTKSYETVKVADGVYAFVAPEPKSGVVNGNTTVIIGEDGVLVVDTGQFPTLAKRMIADIRKLTDKPVRFVVNTHWHWDHNLANYVYREAFPNAAIISTPFTRDSLVDFTPRFLEGFAKNGDQFLAALRAQLASGKKRDGSPMSADEKANLGDMLHDAELGLPEVRQARLEAPNLTFTTTLTLHLGHREAQVVYLGRGNTAGDAVVYVPDAKVLATGDLVVAPTPYATAAYIGDWIQTMKKLLAIDAAAIVPGHGPVMRDKKYAQTILALLESVKTQVDAAVSDGLDLEATKKRVDLDAFRRQLAGDDRNRRAAFDDYFAGSAIESAWKQAKGLETSESPYPPPSRSE